MSNTLNPTHSDFSLKRIAQKISRHSCFAFSVFLFQSSSSSLHFFTLKSFFLSLSPSPRFVFYLNFWHFEFFVVVAPSWHFFSSRSKKDSIFASKTWQNERQRDKIETKLCRRHRIPLSMVDTVTNVVRCLLSRPQGKAPEGFFHVHM